MSLKDILKKIREPELYLPAELKRPRHLLPEDIGAPATADLLTAKVGEITETVIYYPVSETIALPLENEGAIREDLQPLLQPGQSVEAICCGHCSKGGRYAYYLLVCRNAGDNANRTEGLQLNLNLETRGVIEFINASFEIPSGGGETAIYSAKEAAAELIRYVIEHN